ncbi:bcl-2-binding component 3 [Lissotriton helveticus]
MARPFQDGSPPEPVESHPSDGSRPLVSEIRATCSYCCEDCERVPTLLRDPHGQDHHPFCHGYQLSQTACSAPTRTLCTFPATCQADHSVYDHRSIGGEHSRAEQVTMAGLAGRLEGEMVGNGRAHREQPGQDIEREIAARLRRIGDEMNTIYLQRAMEQQGHRVPLMWHVYHFISQVLAVFFNPQGDIMP